MTAQTKTLDVVDISKGTGALTLQPDAHQAVNPSELTCTWVRADDGALVMQWTTSGVPQGESLAQACAAAGNTAEYLADSRGTAIIGATESRQAA
jgi:hypothetical protein